MDGLAGHADLVASATKRFVDRAPVVKPASVRWLSHPETFLLPTFAPSTKAAPVRDTRLGWGTLYLVNAAMRPNQSSVAVSLSFFRRARSASPLKAAVFFYARPVALHDSATRFGIISGAFFACTAEARQLLEQGKCDGVRTPRMLTTLRQYEKRGGELIRSDAVSKKVPARKTECRRLVVINLSLSVRGSISSRRSFMVWRTIFLLDMWQHMDSIFARGPGLMNLHMTILLVLIT